MALRCLLFSSIDLERKQGHGDLGFKVICCALLDGFSGCYFALFCFPSHCHTPSREDQLKREKGYFDSEALFSGLRVRQGHHREGCGTKKRWNLKERAPLQSLDSIYLQRQATGDLFLPIRSSLFHIVLFLIMFVCMLDPKFFELS